MREGTIFQLAMKPREFPAGMRLRNLEWGVLFAVDGTTTIGQIRRAFSIPEAELEGICTTLLERGLIREKPVSLTEYMAAQTAGASAKQPQTLLEMLQGGTALRALALEAGKGATTPAPASISPTATPLIQPPSATEAPMAAKLTPPPLPPEALVKTAPSPDADREPVAAQAVAEEPPITALEKPKVGPSPVMLNGRGSAVEAAPVPNGAPVALAPFTPLAPISQPAPGNTTDSAATAKRTSMQPPTKTDTANATTVHNDAGAGTGDRAGGVNLSAVIGGAAGARRRLSLKSVIEFILSNADDVNAGQLNVYRVFIRVNTRLLKRNGVHSLRFEEDRVITDDELQTAVLTSVERTLGVRCPDAVFV